jgi:hypothetical protein
MAIFHDTISQYAILTLRIFIFMSYWRKIYIGTHLEKS